MELDEMKTIWSTMSAEIENQKKITETLISKVTIAEYKSKLSKIVVSEILGSLVSLAGALFIVLNLGKLNTGYLLVCGVISIVLMILLPLVSLNSVWRLGSISISQNSFKESLAQFSRAKIAFVFAQKINFCGGALLLVTILPVMAQLIGGKDLFKITHLWYWYAIAFPFFYWFACWVFKRYISIASNAEGILMDLIN